MQITFKLLTKGWQTKARYSIIQKYSDRQQGFSGQIASLLSNTIHLQLQTQDEVLCALLQVALSLTVLFIQTDAYFWFTNNKTFKSCEIFRVYPLQKKQQFYNCWIQFSAVGQGTCCVQELSQLWLWGTERREPWYLETPPILQEEQSWLIQLVHSGSLE